ncbi:MAG: CvpA family protein [Alphaproteobacteria bacterium]|nr:CvpA family protein [Alphaproteobacteria bacterium]
MFELTLLDYVYIGVLLVSTLWASMRGGVYETLTMVAWVVAALAARYASPHLNGILQSWFNLTEPTIGTIVAAYFISFFAILLVASFISQRLRDAVQDSFMRLTDHTFGIVFGIVRGIAIMGLVYWGMLYYYSEGPLPAFIAESRARPVMQLTAVKIHEWFVPGENKLLEADMTGAQSSQDIFENLINPAVQVKEPAASESSAPFFGDMILPDGGGEETGTGYRESERDSLESKLLQLDNTDDAPDDSLEGKLLELDSIGQIGE